MDQEMLVMAVSMETKREDIGERLAARPTFAARASLFAASIKKKGWGSGSVWGSLCSDERPLNPSHLLLPARMLKARTQPTAMAPRFQVKVRMPQFGPTAVVNAGRGKWKRRNREE